MPNGGSDCCGTCWFNTMNKGEAGYRHAADPEPAYCTIRGLPLDDPFYTYCANHPHRRPDRDPVPIGPAFIGDATGSRRVWPPSPDTEEIRLHLLDLLSQIEQQPRNEYPIGLYADDVVVWQVGEFKERRAIDSLRRIDSFDPHTAEIGPFGRTRATLVELARTALAKIEHGAAQPARTGHAGAADPTMWERLKLSLAIFDERDPIRSREDAEPVSSV